MGTPDLQLLESQARRRNLLLRLHVTRAAGLAWTLRVGVARRLNAAQPTPGGPAPLVLLGELKGWALPSQGACGSTPCGCRAAARADQPPMSDF